MRRVEQGMLYVLVPYDPAWPDLFEALRGDIVALTGLSRGCIHHIGSTAVRGLSAKPIIDIQVGVPDLDAFDLSRLSGRGFAPAPEIDRDDPFPDERAGYGGWRKKYARLERDNRRLAHVHVRQMGAPNYRFALLMRDYLRHSEMAR
ncbi:GrpB family protein [Marimonas sp. MJW-29]|uniref:GrpB family protein n=1 Tax=Sulfitobacter sediminis TaxID=3234186 RepID=A0ABV3RPL6_9RHOB